MAVEELTQAQAAKCDAEHPLRHLRDEFRFPTRREVKAIAQEGKTDDSPTTYLCGNSLGVQPKRAATYIQNFLSAWATRGVFGHFQKADGGELPPWIDYDDALKDAAAPILGALPSELAVMETLTANLHFLMASFYRPNKDRYKIIIEGKAFPSDHYACESQIINHGYDKSALITITPPDSKSPYLPTQHICDVISEHADTTALVLLPGIQYYSGQLLDIPTITKHAHSLGLTIGWDLAHAAGNVPLSLHDWDVDFAAWCNYKYLNSGPGAIGGLFVHEKHGKVEPVTSNGTNGHAETNGSSPHSNQSKQEFTYRPRLAGWWGNDKSSRFRMDPTFHPRPGAAGFQMSNPSALDMSSVMASYSVFNETTMIALREKSLHLTKFLERLLVERPLKKTDQDIYQIITPMKPEERGAQLSVKLKEGLLGTVMEVLEQHAVVIDERKPDVVRVAPAPLYNNWSDCWDFHVAFEKALEEAVKKQKAQ